MEPHTAPPFHDLTIFALHCKLYTSNLEDIAQEWDFFFENTGNFIRGRKTEIYLHQDKDQECEFKSCCHPFLFLVLRGQGCCWRAWEVW